MAKTKTIFVCQSCGGTSPKMEGKCRHCGEWNTLVEQVQKPQAKRSTFAQASGQRNSAAPVRLTDIAAEKGQRVSSQDDELNRVLGGGIVPGSVILIGGQPGIGKSTLLLQVALNLSGTILYVTGEESASQIKMRANRLKGDGSNCHILTETNVQDIMTAATTIKPSLLIVDSIQTLQSPDITSTPGSVSQVRECAGELQQFAKATGIPTVLIGHITKEGSLAGPKLLEHIVDVVLQFEGDRHHTYRILRTIKNRFGSTSELGIYEMRADGLREVSNPSELLLSQNEDELSGSAIAAALEGNRPLLIETQALVTKAVYGNPQRSTTGFDLRRMNMLLAVLDKRGGLPFGQCDVFLNLAGGLRMDDPAIDLAVLSALMSSLRDVAIPATVAFAGEVGLSGEVRAVSHIEQRLIEAARLGFTDMYIPATNLRGLSKQPNTIRLHPISKVEEIYERLMT